MVWTALRGDVAHRAGDGEARAAADDHMGLLTPLIKGVLTDQGFANTVLAQQIYGGHGYIAEHGMEQFVRDARITMMYEGANGIQALDLVGRKLLKDGGRALQAFLKELQGYIKEHGDDAMKLCRAARGRARSPAAGDHLADEERAAARRRGCRGDRLHASLRLVALGYMWCRIAEAANGKLAAGVATPRA